MNRNLIITNKKTLIKVSSHVEVQRDAQPGGRMKGVLLLHDVFVKLSQQVLTFGCAAK